MRTPVGTNEQHEIRPLCDPGSGVSLKTIDMINGTMNRVFTDCDL